MMAYAIANKKDPLFRHSITLILKMYNEMNNTINSTILSAPHWRMLKPYGGSMSIDKFRETLGKVEYENHGLVKAFRPIATMFEEKLRF